jgi:hypothetical protein
MRLSSAFVRTPAKGLDCRSLRAIGVSLHKNAAISLASRNVKRRSHSMNEIGTDDRCWAIHRLKLRLAIPSALGHRRSFRAINRSCAALILSIIAWGFRRPMGKSLVANWVPGEHLGESQSYFTGGNPSSLFSRALTFRSSSGSRIRAR